MKNFRLPDLGEGLTEAEVLEWFVEVGDEVKQGQELLAVQTAKAVVQVPVPEDGQVEKLCAEVGDVVHVGESLVVFVGEAQDSGTVVGRMKEVKTAATPAQPFTPRRHNHPATSMVASSTVAPAIQQELSCWPALQQLQQQGLLLDDDSAQLSFTQLEQKIKALQPVLSPGEPLRGAQRAMAENMRLSAQQVVPVTLFEEVEITHWPEGTDFTWRLVQGIVAACTAAPVFNAHFHRKQEKLQLLDQIDLGLAMHSKDGLFVPVIRNLATFDQNSLREELIELKEALKERTLTPGQLTGASITLSNHGMIGGTWSTPLVMPPQVAILACGRPLTRLKLEQGQPVEARIVPLSFSFDHQIAGGAEAAQFLMALRQSLMI